MPFGLSTVGGGRWHNERTISASTTALLTDEVLLVDATAAPVVITLPALAQAGAGFRLTAKKIDSSANAMTLDGSGAETIDGAATLATTTQWASRTVQASPANANWMRLFF